MAVGIGTVSADMRGASLMLLYSLYPLRYAGELGGSAVAFFVGRRICTLGK